MLYINDLTGVQILIPHDLNHVVNNRARDRLSVGKKLSLQVRIGARNIYTTTEMRTDRNATQETSEDIIDTVVCANVDEQEVAFKEES